MEERNIVEAVLRGARNRCPHCGQGALFQGYLTKVDHCAVCGEDYREIRPADGPAFFVLCIVCLLLIPAQLFVSIQYRDYLVPGLIVLLISMIAISALLLRPVKGAVIGLQWAGRDYQP